LRIISSTVSVLGRAKETVLKADCAYRFRFSATSGFLMII